MANNDEDNNLFQAADKLGEEMKLRREAEERAARKAEEAKANEAKRAKELEEDKRRGMI